MQIPLPLGLRAADRPRPPLIGLYSPAPQSGKTTLAKALYPYGWTTVKLAGPLKSMLVDLILRHGIPDADIARMIDGDLKHVPHKALNGRTPRHALQTLGTEWGRMCMGEDFWVNQFAEASRRNRFLGLAVICDDVRFINEAETIKQEGGLLVRVTRPGIHRETTHPSEGGLDDWPFDHEIVNDAADAPSWAKAGVAQISEITGWV